MESFLEYRKKIASLPFFSTPLYLKYRLFIVPIIVLIIALTIFILVTLPQLLKLAQTFKDINDLRAKKAFFENKLVELQNLNYEDYQKKLDTALVALPVDKDVPGVIGQLLVAVSSSGLKLEGISLSSSPTASQKVEEYIVRLEVSGTVENLSTFLERVKFSPRVIKLSGIDINKGVGRDVTAVISFVTLYQTLPESIGSIDQPVPKLTSKETQELALIESRIKDFPQISSQVASESAVGKLNPFAP